MKKRKEMEREYERLVEQESLILEATEMITELLEESGENRKGLAEKLGRSKGFVTQILSGDRNMTLRTLADFTFALEHRVKMRATPLVEQGDGGEALGGEGRVMARVFPAVGERFDRSADEQTGEHSRRPLAAESAGGIDNPVYNRFLNARSEGDWGEKLLWDLATETLTGMERVASRP